jgi:hypothetical protein
LTLAVVALGEARQIYMTGHRCISAKNIFEGAMSCACELVFLFSVEFYLLKAVHKFVVGLLQPNQLTNGDQWKVTDTMTETFIFFYGAYMLSS